MGAMTVKLGKSATVGERHDDGGFSVIATIDVRLLENESSDDPATSVKATFELCYRLPSDFAPEEADLSSFAEMNGVYNAWPYWREYIQSTISRMNLPPVVLPLFRIGKALEETSDPKQTSG
jgi:preprotein translocase subunit SecB